MDEDEALAIFDRRCLERRCWRFRMPGLIYCIAHTHGFDHMMVEEERDRWREAAKLLGIRLDDF